MKIFSKLFILFLTLGFFITKAQTPIYLDPTAQVENRIEDLLTRMTLDEKIGQMTQVDRSVISSLDIIKNYYLGSLLSGGGSSPANNSVKGWADMYDSYQNKALETRLKIPLIYGIDAVHGHNNVRGAVIFPHNIGLGCTRNPELIKRAAEIAAEEVAATGIDWTFAPCIAVVRDERWGRTYEGFGETPELAQLFGPAAVKGFQGDSLSGKTSILACAKHYMGDGGTQSGDDQGNTIVDEQTLRAIHLPGYIEAIANGVGSIMPSYSSWNGQKMHGNKYLLTDVLKNELGFTGFLISDWAGIDQLPGTYSDKVEASINAGIDMVMVPHDYESFISTLKYLILTDKVSIERIDDAVRRILKIKFEMGLFENPLTDRTLQTSFGSAEHRQVARQCVRESLVLLKKKDGVLPLPKSNSKIFVAGSNADDIGNQCGGWTISWQGGSGNITTGGTTILNAIKKAVQTTSVEFSETGDFTNTDAGYSIAVIGETPYAEGNGDRADLTISDTDISLIKKLKALGKPVIVILSSGRPMILEPILHYSDAIIAAWLPGTEGEGVADILFEDYQPTGLLSHSWPKDMAQIPINIGDNNYNPLFEYGFGITSLNDSPIGSAPVYLSSLVAGSSNKIEVTFNKAINSTTVSNANFKVNKNGAAIASNISVELENNDNTTIILTIGESVDEGDEITIEYKSGSILSNDGGVLSPFGPVEVYVEEAESYFSIPGKIEAEDYSNMSGVQTENTSDTGGGLNVGYIDDNDWLEYNINATETADYEIYLRVSAQSSSGKISILSNNSVVGAVTIPVTGAWQTWTTISKQVPLNSGLQTLRIRADEGGFNLNWILINMLTSAEDEIMLPNNYVLNQNYPNPFNPSTTIKYSIAPPNLPQGEALQHVQLKVYDMLGTEVTTLVDEEKTAGNYEVKFDGSNLSSGIYFYNLTAGDFNAVGKMMLIK